MQTGLCGLSATSLSDGYRDGKFTPRDVAEDLLVLVGQRNPELNAFVHLDPDAVRASADASAERFAAGTPLSRLDGVPVSVKDNLFVRGMRATWGSRLYEHFVPDADEIAVARLRAAGAIIFGKTNTPEFAMASITDNPLFGVTRNPLNPGLTPGGSSGGGAAQVAGFMGPLALVTDAGGSTRRPASFCGIAGFKPGIGTVPRLGGFPALAQDLQVIGSLARSFDDLSLLHDVISGPDPRDPSSFAPPVMSREGGGRILIAISLGGYPVDPFCRAAAFAVAEALSEMGHEIDGAEDIWDPEEIEEIFGTLIRVGIARVVETHDDWRDRVTPASRALAEQGFEVSATRYVRALERIRDLRERIDARLVGISAIVTPVAASGTWPIGLPAPTHIDGQEVPASAGRIFATAVNVLGLPAISVPAARDRAGMPYGAQVVVPRYRDRAALDLGITLQERLRDMSLAPVPTNR